MKKFLATITFFFTFNATYVVTQIRGNYQPIRDVHSANIPYRCQRINLYYGHFYKIFKILKLLKG